MKISTFLVLLAVAAVALAQEKEPIAGNECQVVGCTYDQCVAAPLKRQTECATPETREDMCRIECKGYLTCELNTDNACAFASAQVEFDRCYGACVDPTRPEPSANPSKSPRPEPSANPSKSPRPSANPSKSPRPNPEDDCRIAGCLFEYCVGSQQGHPEDCKVATTAEQKCRVECSQKLSCKRVDAVSEPEAECGFVDNELFDSCEHACLERDPAGEGECAVCGGVCLEVTDRNSCATPKRLTVDPIEPCIANCEIEFSTCQRREDGKCGFVKKVDFDECKRNCQPTECFKVGCNNDLCSPNPDVATTCVVSPEEEKKEEGGEPQVTKTKRVVTNECRSRCASTHGECSLRPEGGCAMTGAAYKECVAECESTEPPVPAPTPKPCDQPLVNCFVDPCKFAERKCPNHPDAVCRADYCGGCNAHFFVGDREVTEDCQRPEVVCGGLNCVECARADGCSACYGSILTNSSSTPITVAHCVPTSVSESDRCLAIGGTFSVSDTEAELLADADASGNSRCVTFEKPKPQPPRPVVREDFEATVNANSVAVRNSLAGKYVIVITIFVHDGVKTERTENADVELNVFKVAVDLVDSDGSSGTPTDEDRENLCAILKNSLQETQAIDALSARCFLDRVEEPTKRQTSEEYSYVATLEGQGVAAANDSQNSGVVGHASIFSATLVVLSVLAYFF